jgi:hypothetical protein
MKLSAKTISILCLVLCSAVYSFADRGLRKKSKNKVVLNISTNTNFKNDLSNNLKSGLRHKGIQLNESQLDGKLFFTSNILSYKKGNTIYLIPNKQKIIIPEISQGYTGMKLIIKSNN